MSTPERSREDVAAITTYTPMLWAVLNADQRYAEYVRVREAVDALQQERNRLVDAGTVLADEGEQLRSKVDALQQDVRRLEAELKAAKESDDCTAAMCFALAGDVERLTTERNEASSEALENLGRLAWAEDYAKGHDAQVREAEERAFMAGYHAHFDKASALAHELGENNLGPPTARVWKFTDNVIAGDLAPEALAAYKASAAGARTDASPHTCMGGDPGSGLNGPCLACEQELTDGR